MRRMMFLGCFLAGLVLLSGMTPAPAQATCAMVGLTGSCDHGVVKITWGFLCTSQCVAKVVQVDRKCGAGGKWEKIADGAVSPFYDEPPADCPLYYKLTYVVECPEGISIGSREVGPIYCN